MPNVTTLTDLYNDLRRERGSRGRLLSHRDAAAAADAPGMYETFRLIGAGRHSGRIGEQTVAALIRLGLNERDVRRAAGHQLEQSLGPFVLPDRMSRLTLPQREALLTVMDVILAAAEAPRSPLLSSEDDVDVKIKQAELDARREELEAASHSQGSGKRRSRHLS